jgi:hypothetical protein
VPLTATENNPHHLFSSQHLRDKLNIILLNYPVAAVLLIAPGLRRLEHRWFYLLALLPALLFVIFVDPKIGALRDWDLLSVAAAPAIVLTIALLTRLYHASPAKALSLSISLLFFAIIHTGGWIVGNTQPLRSYEYIRGVVRGDVHYSRGYYGGYRNKSWSTVVKAAADDLPEIVRAQRERLAGDPEDHMNRYNLAMHYHVNLGNSGEAADLLTSHWSPYLGDTDKLLDIADIFIRANQYRELKSMYEAFASDVGVDSLVSFNYATLLEARGDIEKAHQQFKNAFAVWTVPPAEARVRFALFCLQNGYFDDAVPQLRAARSSLPDEPAAIVNRILSAIKDRDEHQIDSLTVVLTDMLGR